MSTQQVANRLFELCSQGHFDQASEELYDQNIVSVEPHGDPRESKGMDAIRAKMEWWNNSFEVLSAKVEGPWVNEPCFIVKFILDVKNKENGETSHMEELAVYTVENGKIVHERFF